MKQLTEKQEGIIGRIKRDRKILPLTEKQELTLETLIENPHCSIEELAEIMGIKKGTIYKRLVGLRDKEFIQFTGKARSIEILRHQ